MIKRANEGSQRIKRALQASRTLDVEDVRPYGVSVHHRLRSHDPLYDHCGIFFFGISYEKEEAGRRSECSAINPNLGVTVSRDPAYHPWWPLASACCGIIFLIMLSSTSYS